MKWQNIKYTALKSPTRVVLIKKVQMGQSVRLRKTISCTQSAETASEMLRFAACDGRCALNDFKGSHAAANTRRLIFSVRFSPHNISIFLNTVKALVATVSISGPPLQINRNLILLTNFPLNSC